MGGTRVARLDALDLLRGFVMALMALDHTRDFFSSARIDPTDLAVTTPALFATRWITHLCAPTFMLLVGTGAYLSLARGMSKRSLSAFLVTRGLWMIVLELTIVKLGWFMSDFNPQLFVLLVLWALGWSMIILAALIHLPLWAIGVISTTIIVGHNALDSVVPADLGALAPLWSVLHEGGPVAREGGWEVFAAYPLIPWMGVTGLGYVLGALLSRDDVRDDPARRRRLLVAIGAGLLALFAVVRVVGVYGEPQPWIRGDVATTVMSFLDVSKYPPSLLYLCATLGVAMVLLAVFDGWRGAVAEVLIIFGRVPMFFYLLHLPLIHVSANIAYGGERAAFSPDPWGVPLWGVYAIWIAVCAVLYPLCRWYARVKSRSTSAWLRYV